MTEGIRWHMPRWQYSPSQCAVASNASLTMTRHRPCPLQLGVRPDGSVFPSLSHAAPSNYTYLLHRPVVLYSSVKTSLIFGGS